jgi:hypothetical protein
MLALVVRVSMLLSNGYPTLRPPPHASENGCFPALMNYVHPSVEVAHVRRSTTGDDASLQSEWCSEELQVRNARPNSGNGHDDDEEAAAIRSLPSLHRQGAELITTPSLTDRSVDFLDTADVMDRYYPMCEQLLRNHLGPGVQVTAFDHNIRMAADESSSSSQLKNSGGSTVQNPLGLVHGDYTAVSAPRRLADLAKPPKANDVWRSRLGAEQSLLDADQVQDALQGKRRYAIVNVWRSIDREDPVTSFPLAFCDATTVRRQDLRTLQIHYADRVGENYLAVPSTRHAWLFFHHMTYEDALLIKQWDSAGDLASGRAHVDGAIASFCLHSAFLLPASMSDQAKPRKSIEVRCVCLWEPDES